MTPEQLREYAAEKERAHDALVSRYMDAPAPSPLTAVPGKPEPWEKDVEFEGVTYRVDMRRLKSREFVRRYAAVRKSMESGGGADIEEMMGLFGFVFENIDKQVESVVIEKLGYDDFEEIYRIESGIFEAVEAKN